MKITCLVVCFVLVKCTSADSNLIPSSVGKYKVASFQNCVRNVDLSCLELLVKSKIYELSRAREIRIADNVVIERLDAAAAATEDQNVDEGRGVGGKDWLKGVTHFLSNRALKVNLWDMINLRLSKSMNNPDNVRVSFGLTPEIKRLGKKIRSSHHMARVVVPLIVGFLMTGKLILSFALVKALLMKAFVLSNVAFIAAVYLLVKKFFMSSHNPYHDLQQITPYHSTLDHGYGGTGYGYPTPYGGGLGHYATIQPNHHQAWAAAAAAAAQHHGGDYDHGGGAGVAGDDLQGHYSNNFASTANATSKMRRKYGYGGLVGLVNSHANRSPVLAYRVASMGRSA